MLSRLTRISEEYNVAVYVPFPARLSIANVSQLSFLTNQVQSDPGANAMFAGADKKPIGGHVMVRLSLALLSSWITLARSGTCFCDEDLPAEGKRRGEGRQAR